MTLEELRSMAEREFATRADAWVRAIAKWEEISFDELRPHLVSLYHKKGSRTRLVFDVPEHTPVTLLSDFFDFRDNYAGASGRVLHLVDGKLVGEYKWYVGGNFDDFYIGRRDLGRALMLAHQAYIQSQDEAVEVPR